MKVKGRYCYDYENSFFEEYQGEILRDFEDGSFIIITNEGKELLIETYYKDTLEEIKE